MAYRVIKAFNDLKDGKHRYEIGDAYPRKGATTDEARIAELSTTANKLGTPLIEEKPKAKATKVAEVKVVSAAPVDDNPEAAETVVRDFRTTDVPKKSTRKRKAEVSEG